MIKRAGKWVLIENSAHKEIEKALRKTETKFLALYSSMTEGVAFHDLIYDESGRPIDYVVTDINPAFEQITGISREDAVNKKASELYGTKFAPFLDVYSKVVETGVPALFITYFPPMEKHFSISCIRPSEGKFATVFRDITDAKLAEEALVATKAKLQEYTTNLEKLVEERTNKLRDTERLAAIGATAGMVGHDIRNPLQAITGEIYLLKEELTSSPKGKPDEGVIESIDSIEKNILYINKIVADLQDIARPLKPEYAFTDLSVVLADVLKTASAPSNIEIKTKGQWSKITTEPTFIRRILTNLINNAIQAMPNGGSLEIESNRKGNRLFISVSDTGAGIPEEIKPKLFTPLMTTKSKGQGLGLAVVKRLVEALEGTISFDSQEGKGTTFLIDMPLKQNQPL